MRIMGGIELKMDKKKFCKECPIDSYVEQTYCKTCAKVMVGRLNNFLPKGEYSLGYGNSEESN